MTIALIILTCFAAMMLYIYFTPNGGLKNYDHQLDTGPEGLGGVLMWIIVKLGKIFFVILVGTMVVHVLEAIMIVFSHSM